jgi:hypothetical protein
MAGRICNFVSQTVVKKFFGSFILSGITGLFARVMGKGRGLGQILLRTLLMAVTGRSPCLRSQAFRAARLLH